MKQSSSRYRWFVVGTFFAFMLLHQSDKMLIGPLTTPIMETFGIDEAQMGAVGTGALLIAAIFYPLWGYLYDRYARAKLLALASAIWGATTWLSAIAPTFPTFIATRASTGIDDSSYPGLYSLIADYFGPHVRGRIYGLLQLTQPLGYLLGMVLGLMIGGIIGWRGVFYLTGSLGLVVAVVIFFGVRDVPRGQGEPELADLAEVGVYRFSFKQALGLFRKRTLIPLFIQGFFGVFPWNVIAFWFFRYLETERGFSSATVLPTMGLAVIVLAAGYFVGGSVGDWLFRRTPRGRLIAATCGSVLGMIFMALTVNTPMDQPGLFTLLLLFTALFIPFPAANVLSTVYDVALPEVRSTALAVQYFIENIGSALAPLIAGAIAAQSTLGEAIFVICTVTWLINGIFLAITTVIAPKDIAALRQELRERAAELTARQGAAAD